MENYRETLTHLISLKKDKKIKEPNSNYRKAFKTAWLSLANSDGYTEEAEQFLYDGLVFGSGEAFKNYLSMTQDPLDVLKIFVSKISVHNNIAVSSAILIQILGLLLNDEQPDLVLIAFVISSIPDAVVSKKKKKVYGQLDRCIKKYLFDVIKRDSFPSFDLLKENGLTTLSKDCFVSAFRDVFENYDISTLNGFKLKNYFHLKKWIFDKDSSQNLTDKENQIPDATTDNITDIHGDEQSVIENKGHQEKSGEADHSISSENSADGNLSEKNESEDVTNEIIEGLTKTLAEAEQNVAKLNMELKSVQSDRKSQSIVIQDLKQQLSSKMLFIERLQDGIAERNVNIRKLETEKKELTETIEILKAETDQKDKEISDKTMVINALRGDRSRQSDEVFNRLAAKLRFEYRDFEDALSIPMDEDLGENMREQLKNVFRILKESGVEFDH